MKEAIIMLPVFVVIFVTIAFIFIGGVSFLFWDLAPLHSWLTGTRIGTCLGLVCWLWWLIDEGHKELK